MREEGGETNAPLMLITSRMVTLEGGKGTKGYSGYIKRQERHDGKKRMSLLFACRSEDPASRTVQWLKGGDGGRVGSRVRKENRWGEIWPRAGASGPERWDLLISKRASKQTSACTGPCCLTALDVRAGAVIGQRLRWL